MPLPPPESTDFIQYWSALQLASQGLNPYDPQLMLTLQKAHGLLAPEPTMMWNPPWLLLIMAPFVWMEPNAALAIWRVVSAAIACAAMLLVRRALADKATNFPAGLTIALLGLSLSLWYGISTGQIHALLLLALALHLYGRARSQSWVTALSLVLMTIKPHIFYLVGLRVFFEAGRDRDLTILRRSALLALMAVITTELIWPGLTANWVHSALASGAGGNYVPVQSWAVGTLVYPLRLLFSTEPGMLPVAPMVLLPGLTAICCALWWIYSPQSARRAETIPYLMVLSYLTSPYGWPSDQLVLIPAVYLALSRISTTNIRLAIGAALLWISAQLVGWRFAGTVFDSEDKYLWLPLLTAVLIAGLEYWRGRSLKTLPT